MAVFVAMASTGLMLQLSSRSLALRCLSSAYRLTCCLGPELSAWGYNAMLGTDAAVFFLHLLQASLLQALVARNSTCNRLHGARSLVDGALHVTFELLTECGIGACGRVVADNLCAGFGGAGHRAVGHDFLGVEVGHPDCWPNVTVLEAFSLGLIMKKQSK
jgi:hypothetical protein